MSNQQQHISIVPRSDGAFVRGLPGIPPNDTIHRGARVEGQVQISLPFLGAPASLVEIQLQKSESVTLDGRESITTTDQIERIVLWPPRRQETSDIYAKNFSFSIRIPEDLPPSISLQKQGIEIQYSLRAVVHRQNRISFWSDRPLSCTMPVDITKYEHHPAWPIYHNPEPKQLYHGGMRFTSKPTRTCYSPGETISLNVELSVGSYSVIPRSVEFTAKLQQVITTLSSPTEQPDDSREQYDKKTTIDLISKEVANCARVDHSSTFAAHLACRIPNRDINPTLSYRSRFQIAYSLIVTTIVHSEHLKIDVPIIISSLSRHTCKADLERAGTVPSLGGAPNLDYLSLELPSPEPRSEYKRISGATITASPEPKSLALPEIDFKVVDPEDIDDRDPIQLARTRSLRSGSVNTLDFDFFTPGNSVAGDHVVSLNEEILKSWFQGSETTPLSNTIVGTGMPNTAESAESPSVSFTSLVGDLTDILQSPEMRKELLGLKGDQAQVVVNFLDSILLALDPSKTRLRKQVLITLYRLCKASHHYPECYTLHNIEIGSQEGGGGFCDIRRGRHGDRYLCLKVVRTFRRTETENMIKLFAKEAILWSQLCHPNILPFYGIFYLGEERRMCLVSPWMNNGNLANYLRENPLAPRRPFICDVIAGLEYLHDRNIIHGDLKGVNVLVTSSKRACITDFGLSSVLVDKSLTESTAMTTAIYGGTYRWVAPELLEETESNPTHPAVINMIVKGRIPSQRHPSDPGAGIDMIDEGMWALLKHCWSFKPTDRPSCRKIMEELGIVNLAGNYDATANGHIAEFRSAMRNGANVPIDFPKIGAIFSEIKQTQGYQSTSPYN
ncbi:hypothetical protein NP233_g6605 [Leucocoprinus birnbaumii]|uniref:Protein kinase domain-containing protein n=1 Tax=Leucocoprinus birnbaumii TaxID=56174 RepID=A0AAD5YQS5_9AGAR|nr:hypothetical protein NP233_g6605 [Leucocoprinus birnbaumii]